MIGKCAICKQEKELTFEHIPPRSSGNDSSVKSYEIINSLINEDVMPWELEKIRWKDIKQQGQGFKSICRECNNFLGVWYVRKYNDFISQLINPKCHRRISKDTVEVTFFDIYPLEIFKQILSMLMTLNYSNNVFDLRFTEYLLNKECRHLPNEVKIHTYINSGSICRYSPYQIAHTNTGSLITTELGIEPLGYLVYHQYPTSFKIDCTDITFFNSFKFDQAESFSLLLKVKEVNSGISNDFRAKSEFDSRKS